MKLFTHQIEGVQLFADKNKVALYHQMGLGKTLTALKCFEYLRSIEKWRKMIVFCPLTLIHNAWIEDIQKYTKFTYQDMHAPKALDRPLAVDIYLCNYEMLLSSNKYEIIKGISRDMMCVLDESQRIKNFKAMTSKRLLSLKNFYPYKLLLSGTPAPNDMTEYWSQMTFLSDIILPTNFYKFRNTFFHLSRGNQVMPAQGAFISKRQAKEIFSKGFKYAITDENKEHILKLMAPWISFKKTEDCVDLPESTEIYRNIDMTPKQANIYKQMKNDLIAEVKGKFIPAPVVLTKLNKLRQITGGFIISEGEPLDIENAKLKELLEVIDEVGDKQMIIWAWFTHEINMIKQALGDDARIVNGTVSTDDKTKNIQDFKAGEYKYLIANPQSIAHGITLTNCQYAVYYSLSYSHEQFYQSKARILRISQTQPCFYIYLQCKDTIDQTIMDVLAHKQKAEDVAFRFMKGE